MALLCVTAGSAAAQPSAQAVSGVIRDSSGAGVPGATIRVVGLDTTASVEATSDGDGRYGTAAVAPGRYRVEVRVAGFEGVDRQIVVTDAPAVGVDVTLTPSQLSESVVVTARRVEEAAQDVPIPLSVVDGRHVNDTGAFNVNRLKELLPTVQFYSTNPRNSAVNIRGLGAPFGLTNDGLESGVGLYVDGVFYARPAAATLDFLDVERIEVLRGPQGTLFGKNTTAGAINVTTRKPSFTREADVELSTGDVGFLQVKASASGPIARTVAGRVSFSGTQRDGTVFNTRTQSAVNDLDNLGLRGQLLVTPSSTVAVTVVLDHTRQRPDGYTQVVAGVAPTERPLNRQYAQIAADLGYAVPSFNAFDRLTDVDSPLRSFQDLGGVSTNLDWTVGRGLVTSTAAWRYWNWDPSSDRDFIGLPVTTISAAPSRQRQWTQEVRYALSLSPSLAVVAGGFGFHQTIVSDPSFTQEQGAAAARFLLAPTAAAATPGLLDGYGYHQVVDYADTSAAVFGQATWSLGSRLRVLPGLRVNYDQKKVEFDQQVYGGLQTTDPALIALQQSIFAPQAYAADVSDTNLSGQLTVQYTPAPRATAYVTYATGFKPVGLNLNGLPTDADNRPILSTAVVKPEDTHNVEAGVKTAAFRGVTANLAVFDTTVRNFQTQVTNGDVGVIRGYLANADRVLVRGAELDATAHLGRRWSAIAAATYTDGRYVSFPDAPPPLEETGGPQIKDISGTPLPGISRWAWSTGTEYQHPLALRGLEGLGFAALDVSSRSSFSSSASYSRYLVVPGYALLNARIGFRATHAWSVSLWSRNLLNKDYYELLNAAPGNTGLFVGQPGDARQVGVSLRVALGSARP
ncbi:MAG TPA: TonB-dependent receptor [Vicinamibacterales bacterium]